jgi:hypothetical protein
MSGSTEVQPPTRGPAVDRISASDMAISTPLACALPDEQAAPADTITPSRSSIITCMSDGKPAVTAHSTPGRRGAASPAITAPSAFSRSAAASRHTACPAACGRSRRAASAAAPKPARPETFSVPGRRPCS